MKKQPAHPPMNAYAVQEGEQIHHLTMQHANLVVGVMDMDTLQVVKHRWGKQGTYRRTDETHGHGRAIPMLLWCPECNSRHIDDGKFATEPHHTHACQQCGMVWRPAVVHTVGVQWLPGFRDAK